MNELDLFICTNHEFTGEPKNPAYSIDAEHGTVSEDNHDTPVYQDSKKENNRIFMLRDCYRTWSRIAHIYQNIDLYDYVGICTPEKMFSFMPENLNLIPDIETMFGTFDAILGTPVKLNLIINYYQSHNIQNLATCLQIIGEKFPEYMQTLEKITTKSEELLYPSDMFILRKKDFMELCNFIFTILAEFDARMGFNKTEDVEKYVEDNIDKFFGTRTVEYQKTIHANVIERLFNIWLMHKDFKIVKTYESYSL